MRLNTDGLVIREQNIGEADRRVTLLTRDYGLVHAFARGARRIKSNTLTATQLLSYSRFSIFQGRDCYIIDEAEPIEVFFTLRGDMEALSLALYFAQLMAELAPELDEAAAYLRLILNTLHLLAGGKRPPLQLKSIFELRLLSIAGYMPNLVACEACGAFESDPMFFDAAHGNLYCQNCRPREPHDTLPLGAVTAMRHIVFSDFDKLFNFTLSSEGLQALANTTEHYLLMQIQRRFPTLEFYHQMSS
ncbi:MAG TPA: DNA repair protein RecO [Candidatus Fimivicinus intestinavium]|nr:DNA repair protein RecO [Candidatus Fimivicinus intestinavium]